MYAWSRRRRRGRAVSRYLVPLIIGSKIAATPLFCVHSPSCSSFFFSSASPSYSSSTGPVDRRVSFYRGCISIRSMPDVLYARPFIRLSACPSVCLTYLFALASYHIYILMYTVSVPTTTTKIASVLLFRLRKKNISPAEKFFFNISALANYCCNLKIHRFLSLSSQFYLKYITYFRRCVRAIIC